MATNLVGYTLRGNYEIIKPLGKGGMGLVWHAHDLALDREVAVKIIRPEYAWSSKANDGFIKEARVIARLEHPHILSVYDFGSQTIDNESLIYLVMRLASGGTLRDRLKSGGLPLNEVKEILKQICEALDYAHSKGIIHLDLKPDNILFDDRGSALVADFGLAKLLEAATHVKADTRIGTLAYMPPEQFLGGNASPPSDLYALGITIYEMLTGQLPRRGSASRDFAIILNDTLPSNIRSVIEKATQFDSNRRYRSARELMAAFTATTDSFTIKKIAVSQKILAGISAISVIVVASFGFVYFQSKPPPQPTVEAQLKNPVSTEVVKSVSTSDLMALAITPSSKIALQPTKTTTPEPTKPFTPTPPTPTNTSRPSTSTPRPPTDTPQPPTPSPTVPPTAIPTPCAISLRDPLFEQWKEQLGCPIGQVQVIEFGAEQAMRGGHLFWRKDNDQFYVIYDRNKQTGEDLLAGSWSAPSERWNEADTCIINNTSPEGTPPMVRGFSWWWCQHGGGPDGPLGWPLDKEYGRNSTFTAQPFANGLIWRGSDNKTYALLYNGKFFAVRS